MKKMNALCKIQSQTTVPEKFHAPITAHIELPSIFEAMRVVLSARQHCIRLVILAVF